MIYSTPTVREELKALAILALAVVAIVCAGWALIHLLLFLFPGGLFSTDYWKA